MKGLLMRALALMGFPPQGPVVSAAEYDELFWAAYRVGDRALPQLACTCCPRHGRTR